MISNLLRTSGTQKGSSRGFLATFRVRELRVERIALMESWHRMTWLAFVEPITEAIIHAQRNGRRRVQRQTTLTGF